jgi:hypothetical protein
MIECTEAEKIERLNARVVELLREKEAADQACQRLCGKHGYGTGHGDTVADMIDEISAQIPTEKLASARKALQHISDMVMSGADANKAARIAHAALTEEKGK